MISAPPRQKAKVTDFEIIDLDQGSVLTFPNFTWETDLNEIFLVLLPSTLTNSEANMPRLKEVLGLMNLQVCRVPADNLCFYWGVA